MGLKDEVKARLEKVGYDALSADDQELARDFGLVRTRKLTLPEIYANKWASAAGFVEGALNKPDEAKMKSLMSGSGFSTGQIDASFTPCDRSYSIIAKWAFNEGLKAAAAKKPGK